MKKTFPAGHLLNGSVRLVQTEKSKEVLSKQRKKHMALEKLETPVLGWKSTKDKDEHSKIA